MSECLVDAGALLLASDDDAADRRARFAVVGRDAPSADAAADAAVLLHAADNTAQSSAEVDDVVALQQRETANDGAGVTDRASSHLYRNEPSSHRYGIRVQLIVWNSPLRLP